MRFSRVASGLLLAGGLAGLNLTPAGGAEPAPAAVVVHTDQVSGRLVPDSVTNASYEAVYGQTTSPLADAAFQWVRATNSLSYVRCYNWLGDGIPRNRPEWFAGCRVARRGPAGQIVYQWEALERVLDTLIASGVKPFLVCGGVPDALAAGPIRRNEGGQAANRPRDYAQYQDMIAQMVRRLVKTYGVEEVRTWYFEAWSQPDHEGSWEGGRPAPFAEDADDAAVEPFCRLYDHFAAGVLSVDEKLRVGGPGLAGDLSFFRRFLAHCARGPNAVGGRVGARLDFISWHRYGTVADIVRWNAELRGIVEKDFPELKGAQYVLSECGSGLIEGSRALSAYEAARMAALLDANNRASENGAAKGVDLMFRTGDLTDDHFDGFRPLITRIGLNTVPTPAFRLYMLLAKMGLERLKAEAPDGVGVVATRASTRTSRNATQALVYRYDPSVLPGAGEPGPVRVRFTGLPPTLLRLPLRVYLIDEQHNAPYEAWVAAGRPKPTVRPGEDAPAIQDGALRELGARLAGEGVFPPFQENLSAFVNNGEAFVDLQLAPNAVALVTLGVEPTYDVELSRRGERLRKAEADFAAAAEIRAARQVDRAVEALREITTRYADTYWREAALYSLVGIHELDQRNPTQAETVRRELLQLPLDDFTRLRLLERLRVDAARRGAGPEVEARTAEIAVLEAALAAQRQWPLRRWLGRPAP
jgi:hypothetical protein